MAGAIDLSALKQRAPSDTDRAAVRGVEITEANVESELLTRSGQIPVVVLLWSPRSDMCLELADNLATLAANDADKWSLATVNVDAAPRIAQMFGIDAVPTVVALAAGTPVASFQGSQPPEQLRRWIDSLLSATAGKLSGASQNNAEQQVHPALIHAREQLEAGDIDAAATSYQSLLDSLPDDDPQHGEAHNALRQITFLRRATAQPADATHQADACPDNIDAVLAAADIEILNQDVAAAFDRLIAAIRRTTGEQRSVVRHRLIELFDLFDPADPDVIAGRQKLANALY